MALKYEVDPSSDPSTVVVLLHGRGSDRFDLLGLRRGLPPEVTIVTPEAPFPAAPWGYGPGWAWYLYAGEDRPDPKTFSESQRQLREFLTSLPDLLNFRPAHLVLGGFSQGGTMSLAYGLMNPGAVAAVLNFSGFLANHPAVQVTPQSVGETPIFWGHGTADQSIPFAMALAGRAKLREAGARLTALDFPMAHAIDPRELAAASDFVRKAVAAPPPEVRERADER